MKSFTFLVVSVLAFCFSATSYGTVVLKNMDKKFVRGTTAPANETQTFQGFTGTATIETINGDLEDTTVEKVSSSIITVNGVTIFGAADFSQNVASLRKEIPISQGENTLVVLLKGKPGGTLRVKISQSIEGVSAATIIGPSGGTVDVIDPDSNAYGAKLVIPANILTGDVAFSITDKSQENGNVPILPQYQESETPALELVSSAPFSGSVKLCFPTENNDSLSFHHYLLDELNRQWREIGSTFTLDAASKQACLQLDHFSPHQVTSNGYCSAPPTSIKFQTNVTCDQKWRTFFHFKTVLPYLMTALNVTSTKGDISQLTNDIVQMAISTYSVMDIFDVNGGTSKELIAGAVGNSTGLMAELYGNEYANIWVGAGACVFEAGLTGNLGACNSWAASNISTIFTGFFSAAWTEPNRWHELNEIRLTMDFLKEFYTYGGNMALVKKRLGLAETASPEETIRKFGEKNGMTDNLLKFLTTSYFSVDNVKKRFDASAQMADKMFQSYVVKNSMSTIAKTGQKLCFDSAGNVIPCAGTGQDGEIQAGVAWPSPRFVTSDGTMTDKLTGLMWAKNSNHSDAPVFECYKGDVTWMGALDYVSCLNSINYLSHSDWRLPNVLELESLYNANEGYPQEWLASQGFENVRGFLRNYYWSSTTVPGVVDTAFMVGMSGGVFKYSKFDIPSWGFNIVWPVRTAGVGTVPLPKTGQTTSFGNGDDGQTQAGADWPSVRFISMANGTIQDKLSGLSWTADIKTPGPASCAPGVGKDWQEALDFIKCLNANNYLGFADWRLPNRKELLSMSNFGLPNTSWLQAQGFKNVYAYNFWSSTTRVGAGTFNADLYNAGNLTIGISHKTGSIYSWYVWPVRGGLQ